MKNACLATVGRSGQPFRPGPLLVILALVAWIGCGSSGSSGPTDPPSPDPPPAPGPQTVFDYRSPLGDFALLLPPEISTYRGVIIIGPGAQEDTRLIADRSFDNAGVFDDPGFQAHRGRILALAEKHGLAVAGARLPSPDVTSLDRLENLLTALGTFADESDHSELTQAPLLFDGYSAGGCFAYAFTRRHPDRVIGFWTQKGGCHDGRDGGDAKQVPGLLIIGAADTESRCLNITELFENNRPAGALWGIALQPGAGHERMLDFDLLFDWMDSVLEQRLPQPPGSGAPLRLISEEKGWLGDRETAAVAPFEDYDGDRTQASWLPSAEAAQGWSSFVSPGRALGCPSEDPDGPPSSTGPPR